MTHLWMVVLAFLCVGALPLRVPPAIAGEQSARQLWTCGMHPQVIQDHPGSCPICGMKLVPLKGGAASGGDGTTVTIDPAVVQNMGLRTAPVVEGPLRRAIRAVAYLNEPDPGHFDVNLRVSGWIEKLHADVDGMHIGKGDPLFDLYSPELNVAIDELIAARKAQRIRGDGSLSTDAIRAAAQRKLELYGLPTAQILELAKLERAPRAVTFYSPMEAHLTAKMIYAGAAVKAGELVLRLADRSMMWAEAQIFEQDLPLIHLGQPATVRIEALPNRTIEGTIEFIHPHLDPVTRTALARVVLANDGMILRQGMFASLALDVEVSPRAVQVPREAVIDTGTRQIAFVAREAGHFEPRTVRMGTSGKDGMVEILSGLSPGEQVVTSGQFLLDAESRLQEAIRKHLQREEGHEVMKSWGHEVGK